MQQVPTHLAQLDRQLPRSPRVHLLRERLITPLLHESCRLSLLYGPAGSGKTTLMADCARQAGPDVEIIWLDLHGRPLDGAAFLALLHNALHGNAPPPSDEQVIATLKGREQALWLMLDDFPRAPDSPLDAVLTQLLGIQNIHLRWWVSARRRPQCGLPRLLLEEQLQIFGPESLFFSLDEVIAMLTAHGNADEERARRLFERTHGWCAAVLLECRLGDGNRSQAGLAMREHALADYLQEELLDELLPAMRQALSVLSLVPQFNRALCAEALAAEVGAQAFDELLERDLIALRDNNGAWYEVIPVIADQLAGRVDDVTAKAVHYNAYQWLNNAGELRQAIEHALAAGLPDKATELLERQGNSQILNVYQAYKLLEWTRNLPPLLLNGTPELVIINALVFAVSMQAEEAQRHLDLLGNFLPAAGAKRQSRLLAAAQAIQTLIALAKGDAARVEDSCQQALAHLSDHDWVFKRICNAARARQLLFFGELDAARQVIRTELKCVRPLNVPTAEALTELYQAELLEIEGDLPHARRILELSWEHLKNSSFSETGIAGRVQLQLGRLMLCRGALSLAEQHFTLGYQLTLAFFDPMAFLGLVGLAQIAILNEETAKADELLNQAEQLAQRRRISENAYRNIIDLGRARLCIQRQNLPRAEHLLRGILASYRPARSVTQAYCNHGMLFECERLLGIIDLLKGEYERAAGQLERTLLRASSAGFRPQACEAQLALALNALLADNTKDAVHWLQQGLQEAEAMDFLLPVERLRRTRPELFELVEKTRSSSLLSEREVEVLELVAAGYSNQEIAEHLFISVFTVKSHVQRLSLKLEVKRRTQAVAKAKSLGILR